MQIQGKLLVATLVLSVGLGTALLFRRSETLPERSWPVQHRLPLREEPAVIDLGPPRAGSVPIVAEDTDEVATPLAVPSGNATSAPPEMVPPDLPRHYRRDALPVTMQVARHTQMLDTTRAPAADEPRAPEQSAPEPIRPIPRQRTHRVMDGDTLSRLALRYLGSSDRFAEIFEANREVLPEPDVLPIGVMLRIPLSEAPAAQPAPEPPRPSTASSGPPSAAPLEPIPGEDFRSRSPAAAPPHD